MRLTVEILDQKTLNWSVLACHDGVGLDAAPSIVAVLRDGLPSAASIRWNWSRQPFLPADRAPLPRYGRKKPRR